MLPEAAARLPLSPIQVKAGVEVYGLRVDVARIPPGSDLEATDLKNQVPDAQVADPHDYSWVGADLGNGLFIDSNGNLSVDLARLYTIQEPFTVEESVHGFNVFKIVFSRENNVFHRSGGAPDLPDVAATFGDGEVDLRFADQSSQPTIYLDRDGVTFDSHGLLGLGKVVVHQASDRRVQTNAKFDTLVAKNDNEAGLSSLFRLDRKDGVLRIRPQSLFSGFIPGVDRPMSYVLTKTGCFFIDVNGDAGQITRDGNTITVTKNGKVTQTYQVLASAQ
jgi:hypothetical protein